MAWLFVPGLEGSNSGSPSPVVTPIELWVTASGTPMRRPYSWRGWQTRPWIALLSGTILQPSMADRGAARWISSLPDSPASPPATQVGGAAPPTSAGSGQTSPESLARWDPVTCSWRMSEGSLLSLMEAPSVKFSGAWPISGSMRSGTVSARRRSGHPTSASASSSWPTATGQDSLSSASAGYSTESGRHSGTTLTDSIRAWQTPGTDSFRSRGGDRVNEQGLDQQARTWPTPRASANENRTTRPGPTHGNSHGSTLAGEAATWPTPRALTGGPDSDQSKQRRGRGGHDDLQSTAALWATPMAMDGVKPSAGNRAPDDLTHQVADWPTPTSSSGGPLHQPDNERQGNRLAAAALGRFATPSAQMWRSENPDQSPEHSPPLSRQVLQIQPGPVPSPSDPTLRLRLNPAFVDWMLGWPIGWTASESLEMGSFRWWRALHSSLLHDVLVS